MWLEAVEVTAMEDQPVAGLGGRTTGLFDGWR
jgi:hypothetical protein